MARPAAFADGNTARPACPPEAVSFHFGISIQTVRYEYSYRDDEYCVDISIRICTGRTCVSIQVQEVMGSEDRNGCEQATQGAEQGHTPVAAQQWWAEGRIPEAW
ncbi:hypothetical protein GMORB2_1356 [Geosmithia morbida]|uniref:Uncharacterized protein n=1 Tax=Geosmithia morbida TaxID=1094350 RepID=A0A9P5D7U7_9HYPO|nr:uncharacterized protein GMORB2_1356 [Geosmithia morbida]KAF4126110.1 hypothetical protein GMORB2_1356 [Geosmithia morbida]